VGGDEGEGEESFLSTPTPTLPHRKGEGIYWGNFKYFWLVLDSNVKMLKILNIHSME
jgi:hypothetical protein